MQTFLILQVNYDTFDVGLYTTSGKLASITKDKKDSSKELIPTISTLLKENNQSLHRLAFIGVNQGPGPFTSLRVIITTANGLSFASKTPLVGVNSLRALLEEYKDPKWINTVALLNAYNNDLYYGVIINDTYHEGCKNNEILLQDIKKELGNKPIRFIGNGADLNKDLIKSYFGKNSFIPEQTPQGASLDQFSSMALKDFRKSKLFNQLLPLYLKSLSYKPILK